MKLLKLICLVVVLFIAVGVQAKGHRELKVKSKLIYPSVLLSPSPTPTPTPSPTNTGCLENIL